jgi:hypothetical protein
VLQLCSFKSLKNGKGPGIGGSEKNPRSERRVRGIRWYSKTASWRRFSHPTDEDLSAGTPVAAWRDRKLAMRSSSHADTEGPSNLDFFSGLKPTAPSG